MHFIPTSAMSSRDNYISDLWYLTQRYEKKQLAYILCLLFANTYRNSPDFLIDFLIPAYKKSRTFHFIFIEHYTIKVWNLH